MNDANPLISEDYRRMQQDPHKNPNYGAAVKVLADGRNAHPVS